MASISTYTYDKPITVRRGSHQAEPWQAVKIELAEHSLSLSREEAAQLAVDLLNAAEARKTVMLIEGADKAEGLV
ncbi:MAG TPA: hypothetical protein VMV87_18720 [Burkholderiales bacterium]|nr:hypothetical protein [Burkholderiales bacterium]